jgi:hypothetical protein
MGSYLRLASSLGYVTLVGWLTLRAVLTHPRHHQSRVEVLAYSFALGLVVLAVWSVALAALRIPLRLATLVPVAAVPVGLLLIRRGIGRMGDTEPVNPTALPGYTSSSLLPTRVILLVLAVTVVAVFTGSMYEPIAEIDAVAGWGLHAKVFYHERTTFPEFFTSGACGSYVTHWRPLFPLIQTWGHLAMGTYDDHKIKLIFPFIYLSLLGVVYGTMARRLPRAYSLAVLLILATAPALVVYFPSGSVASGLADVVFALLVAAAAGSLLLWVDSAGSERLALAAVFSAAAVWTKREGLPFAALSVALVWGYWYMLRRRRAVPGLLQPLLFTLAQALSGLLLIGYMSQFPGPWMGSPLDLGGLFEAGSAVRFLGVLKSVIFEAGNPSKWGILWIVLALLVVLRAGHLRRHTISLPFLLVAGQIGFTLLFMVVSGYTIAHHRHLDMRRALIHVAPIATLVIGLLSSASATDAEHHEAV